MGKNYLSPHFTLEELTYSAMAIESGLENEPSGEIVLSLRYLAEHLLEPLRLAYGFPIHVLSGYRCREVNQRVGGTGSSQHLRGEAADLYVVEGSEFLLEVLIKCKLEFDQVIVYRRKNFLHVSLKKNGINRRQILRK